MFTLNEALDQIIELDKDIDSADIYFEPPDATDDTDCDIGDEDDIGVFVYIWQSFWKSTQSWLLSHFIQEKGSS